MRSICPFAAFELSDPSRRKLYRILLQKSNLAVSELAKKLKLRQPTVSYHLKKLEKAGLVKSEKKGREVYYQVKKTCPEGKICL